MSDEKVRILLVEDNPKDARQLKKILTETGADRFELIHVGCLNEGVKHLTEGGVDAVLLDLSLPDAHGFRAVKNTHAVAPGIPIIVMTGFADETVAIEALRKGAQDYLIKGQVDGNLLVRAIRYAIERKRTEEALRETRDYLENLLNYANAPIIVWDPEFRITQFNHAFERLTGRDAEEVVGQPLDILFPDDRRDEAMNHIRRATMGERWEVVEIPILRTDGAVRTVLWNSATLYTADGMTVVATIAQGMDITERKQAEEELQRWAEELKRAKETAERKTAELERAFDQLNAAKLDLESFNRAAIGREMRIIEIKREVNKLLTEIGREPKYTVVHKHTKV